MCTQHSEPLAWPRGWQPLPWTSTASQSWTGLGLFSKTKQTFHCWGLWPIWFFLGFFCIVIFFSYYCWLLYPDLCAATTSSTHSQAPPAAPPQPEPIPWLDRCFQCLTAAPTASWFLEGLWLEVSARQPAPRWSTLFHMRAKFEGATCVCVCTVFSLICEAKRKSRTHFIMLAETDARLRKFYSTAVIPRIVSD